MIFKLNNIKIYLLLILLAQSSFVLAQQSTQYRLRGVDFKELHLSPIDSAVLRINSTWYSARDQYGEVNSSNETFYIKWTNDKEKYYPIMKEAWKYCIDHQPNQVRLYKDGIWLNIWMLQAMEDSVKRMKYFDETMKVYDMWIQNLDSINKYTNRISDRSSVGGIMMQKARDYTEYIMKKGKNVYQDAKAKELFVSAAEIIRRDYNLGKDLGGDIDQGGLQYYLGFALNDYANIVNNIQGVKIMKKKGAYNKEGVLITDTAELKQMIKNKTPEEWEAIEKHNQMVDSLNNLSKDNDRLRREAKEPLLEKYNFIIELCDRQINTLTEDYNDKTGGTDSTDVVISNVVRPYNQLKELCANMLKNDAHIDVSIQHLQDVELQYGIDLDSHKKDITWLNLVLDMCENTIDFSTNNLSYPFYEEVYNYYIVESREIEKKKKEERDKKKKDYIDSKSRNEWYYKAYNLYNSLPRARINVEMARKIALIYYYLNRAITANPNQSGDCQKMKDDLRPMGAKGELMMAGIKEGQMITVNGVTFKLNFK